MHHAFKQPIPQIIALAILLLLLTSCQFLGIQSRPRPLDGPAISATDLSPFSSVMSLASAEITFVGEERDDEVGYSLSPAGDVNGDGLSDFIMGAWANDFGGDTAGQVYLILGRSEANWGQAFSLTNADASFVGEGEFDIAGDALGAAGDVNGDGFDDILIGAQSWDLGRNSDDRPIEDVGKAYLIFGRERANWGMRRDLGNAAASFVGLRLQDCSASAVAGVGDVNADGFDDFAIGDFRYHQNASHMTHGRGQTYLVLGHERDSRFIRALKWISFQDTPWMRDVPLSETDASWIGTTDGDFSGFSIAGLGDINGDGHDEFILGAWGYERENWRRHGGEGQSYLIAGQDGDWTLGTPIESAPSSFIGEHPMDRSGWSVANLGDFNGDGVNDIGISAPRFGGANRNRDGDGMGKVYIIPGQADLWAPESSLVESAMATFLGEERGDDAGHRIASAGDVNADGFDDILISAPENCEFGIKSGKVYLIFGAAEGFETDTPLGESAVAFHGTGNWDRAGWTATGVGDVNGDGFDDFAIGSRYSDTGPRNSGEIYLFLGRPHPIP